MYMLKPDNPNLSPPIPNSAILIIYNIFLYFYNINFIIL